MKCLDSTFVMDLLRGDRGAIEKAKALEHEQLAITPIAMHETLEGYFFRGISGETLERVLALLRSFTMLTMSLTSCVSSAQLASALRKAGNEIGSTDAMIVGAMLANNCDTIITRDTDFKRIRGIKVETY